MQSTAWIAFLRHIPASLMDALSIKTIGGTEIAVQAILRVDHEVVAVKGRISGSQDTGRIFFLPFGQIDYVGYLKELKEADFHAAFDSMTLPPPSVGEAVYSEASEPPLDEIPELEPQAAPRRAKK